MAVFGLLLAACDQADKSSVPERPSVVLKAGDQTYEEQVYSYCWPESADNLDCAINDRQLIQPSAIANIQSSEEIHFQVVGDASTPSSITATLLDGPGGVQDLGVSTEPTYSAALAPGLYRVQVDVQYADIEGQQAYVSYVFGLNVGGQAVAAAPSTTAEATEPVTIEVTPAPTLTPAPVQPIVTAAMTEAAPVVTEAAESTLEVAESTDAATMEAVETEAALLAPEVTAEATEATEAVMVTEEPTAAATEEAMLPESTEELATAEAVAMLTETPEMALTVEATQAPVEAQPLGEMTAEATEVVLLPTEEVMEPVATETLPAALPTEEVGTILGETLEAPEATEAIMVTAEPTAEMTEEAPVLPTAEATEALLPTAEATELATEEVLPTAEATEEVLFATPTVSAPSRPTRTPEESGVEATPTATLTVPTQPGDTTQLQVPLLTLNYAGDDYNPVGYQFCEVVTWGEHVCVNVPSSETTPQRILFLRGLTVEFTLTGAQPSSITVEYRSEQGEATGTPETHEAGADMLKLVISPEPGDYIMIVHVQWEAQQQDASYFYRISVLD
jgi:hypothetical protein